MVIPEIAARLRELAIVYRLPELSELADHLRRRPPVRKTRIKSAPMTPELAHQIRLCRTAYPGLSQRQIAERFNVNTGRVSEALRGKRV